jgi:uncharacterized protein (DUF305 family)
MRSLLTLALVAGVLAGCGAQQPQASLPPAPATTQSEFNPTDAAWLELMIPMDEQFVRILGLASTRSSNVALQQLATSLSTSHQAELTQLVALRDRAGLPTGNPHEGHDMPGMMTEDEIVALSNDDGPAFDRVLRTEIKDHLDQSALVTTSVIAAGQAADVKKLATSIKKTRGRQLIQLSSAGSSRR